MKQAPAVVAIHLYINEILSLDLTLFLPFFDSLLFRSLLYCALLYSAVLTFRGLLPSPLPVLRLEIDLSEVENKEPLHASCPSISTQHLQNGKIKGGMYLFINVMPPSMQN